MKNWGYNKIRQLAYSSINALAELDRNPVENGFVVCYHSIGNDGWEFSVTKTDFIKQVDFLLQNYQSIGVEQLEQYLSGEYIPEKPFFLITFDDGYESILEVKDYLKEKGIKPIVFLLGQPNEADRYELDNPYTLLSQNQIKDLLGDGWVLGNHGNRHADISKMTIEELEKEIDSSTKALESTTNVKIKYFAFPKGRYNQEACDLLESYQYRLGFSMDNEILSAKCNKFAIPRVGVMGTHSFSEFKALPLDISVKFRKKIHV